MSQPVPLQRADLPSSNGNASHLHADLTTALQVRIESNPALLAAVVGSVDGRAQTFAAQAGHSVEPARIAALASSLLGLTESFSREALHGNAHYNSIATEHGSIVVVRVPSRARAHVLSVWTARDETFAMTLRAALDIAAQVARLLDHE
ncbi:MAG TPA: roadblock/LC7 domain-containing protein [Rhodanobacteraceae bacterium]|nr:roadblock/LC7 domain-containing protein [Rhodanobacteraceae bacterium]